MSGIQRKQYDDAFNGGCGLSNAAIEFLEAVQGSPTVYLKESRNGQQRVYATYCVKVYGAGSNTWVATRTQYLGSVTANRSASRIQNEAMFVMGVGALNKPALRWLQENLTTSKAAQS